MNAKGLLAGCWHSILLSTLVYLYSRGRKNVSNFVPFPSETSFIYRRNLFRSIPFRIVCHTCVRARAVIREMRRPHCEDSSSSTWVLHSRFAFKKKPCFAPPLASLYRVCGGRVTWNSTERERNETGNVVWLLLYVIVRRPTAHAFGLRTSFYPNYFTHAA